MTGRGRSQGGRPMVRGGVVGVVAIVAALACATPAFADDAAGPLPSRDIRWSATAGGAVDLGSLPEAAPGLAVGLDVRRGALAARTVVSVFRPQTEHASGADVGLFDALAMICGLAPVGRFDIGACGGGGIGLLSATRSASASGPHDSGFGGRPEGVALARVDAALYPVLYPSLYLSLELGTVLDPLRTTLPLAGTGDAARAALFSFRGSLALEVRVW